MGPSGPGSASDDVNEPCDGGEQDDGSEAGRLTPVKSLRTYMLGCR
jgi:hypothetical protein